MIGLLDQLGGWLDQFRDSSVFQKKVPFTSLTLGGLLDLRQAFLARVRSLLESSPGQASFSTAQELAQQLVGLLGGDPSAVRYDPASHLLTYAVQFTHVFESSETPIAFGANLGRVAGIESSSASHRRRAPSRTLVVRDDFQHRRGGESSAYVVGA